MTTEIKTFIFVLLFAAFITAQSTFNTLNREINQGPYRQRVWPTYQEQHQPRPSGEHNYYNNIAAIELDRLSPGATGSLSSIINPGSGSSNNVIGNTNTVYNTFGNRNSFIQNNPK